MKRDPLAAAKRRGRKRMKELLSDKYGPYIKLANVPPQYHSLHPNEISKSIFGKKLIMVRKKKEGKETGPYLIPLWQTADNIAPHMEKILDELKRFDPWTQLLFFVNKNMRLNGKTPLESLIQEKLEEVLLAARTYHKHGAA